jgi:hypothetical protein
VKSGGISIVLGVLTLAALNSNARAQERVNVVPSGTDIAVAPIEVGREAHIWSDLGLDVVVLESAVPLNIDFRFGVDPADFPRCAKFIARPEQVPQDPNSAFARAEQYWAKEAVIGRNNRQALGFLLNSPQFPIGPGQNSFGPSGMGGAMGFCDPDRGLALGYVMNKMHGVSNIGPRIMRVIDAVYGCV